MPARRLHAEGPLAERPGYWDSDLDQVTVPAAAFDFFDPALRSRVAVTRESWSGLGPSGKQGIMVRSAGSLASRTEASVTLDVRPDRLTHWDGVDTRTVST